MKGITNAGGGVPHGSIGTPELSDSAVTAQKIASGAVSTVYTATIPANGWTNGGGGTYKTQTITVNGLLASDDPIIDYQGAGQTGVLQMESLEDYGLIFRMATSANALQVFASDAPTHDLPIKILCIRK